MLESATSQARAESGTRLGSRYKVLGLQSIKIDLHLLKFSWAFSRGYISHRCTHRREIKSRQAMSTFWRTFHHDGKFRPARFWAGVHALPFSLYLPSQAKLWCTLQLRGQDTLLLLLLYPFLLCGCTVRAAHAPQFHWKARLLSNSLQKQHNNNNFIEPASYEPCQSTFT